MSPIYKMYTILAIYNIDEKIGTLCLIEPKWLKWLALVFLQTLSKL